MQLANGDAPVADSTLVSFDVQGDRAAAVRHVVIESNPDPDTGRANPVLAWTYGDLGFVFAVALGKGLQIRRI